MQLYAVDKLTGKEVFISNACKGRDYFCIECGAIVRARLGTERSKHFYHLKSCKKCSQNAKSEEHIQVQVLIKNALLSNGHDAFMEYRYPEIGRIADVVSISAKVVFEIQCSQIDSKEIADRCSDYESMGFSVIWILHERVFGKGKLSAAEKFLYGRCHYFTNIDKDGKGSIFDKYRVIKSKKEKNVVVDINAMKIHSTCGAKVFPSRKSWKIYCSGDLIDMWNLGLITHEENEDIYDMMISQENISCATFAKIITTLGVFVVRIIKNILKIYKITFQMIIEKYSE